MALARVRVSYHELWLWYLLAGSGALLLLLGLFFSGLLVRYLPPG